MPELIEVAVDPRVAARIGRRGRAMLERSMDPERRSWLAQAEGLWVRRLEGPLVAAAAAGWLLWMAGILISTTSP